jgi:hypothetical protein
MHFDEAVHFAWKHNYVGEHHLLLRNNIRNMRHDEPMSNTVSIIQSSGTGKSRMVDSLACVVFTIPFNIRSTRDDRGMFAFCAPALDTYCLN